MFSLKTFDEDKRMSCRDDFSVQCCDIAANEWRKEKREEEEYNKCWWEISEDEYKRTYEEKIREEEKEFLICDVRKSRRKEFKCTSFSEVLHWWHNIVFERYREFRV